MKTPYLTLKKIQQAVTTAYSRLAMKIPGCRNLFFYDCNPASPLHWAYTVFIRKLDFKTDTPLARPGMYTSMLINPDDNADNLDADYIEDVLESLPDTQKARFRYGQWVQGEGCIYERFTEDMILKPEALPNMEYYTGGRDFGAEHSRRQGRIQRRCRLCGKGPRRPQRNHKNIQYPAYGERLV